jgi:hypothetical protein
VTARPYWVEFPGSSADKGDPYCRSHNAVSLERALSDARSVLWRRWKENREWVYPCADVAVITNRDTGYRWILRRGSDAVEFQTPGMLAEQVASDQLNLFLSVEEAEALAGVAESAEVTDKRKAAVVRQAAGQLQLLASQVREARRQAETHVDWYAELKRDLRRAERARAERDLAKAEAAVARLRELLARQPEPPEDPARRTRPSSLAPDPPRSHPGWPG